MSRPCSPQAAQTEAERAPPAASRREIRQAGFAGAGREQVHLRVRVAVQTPAISSRWTGAGAAILTPLPSTGRAARAAGGNHGPGGNGGSHRGRRGAALPGSLPGMREPGQGRRRAVAPVVAPSPEPPRRTCRRPRGAGPAARRRAWRRRVGAGLSLERAAHAPRGAVVRGVSAVRRSAARTTAASPLPESPPSTPPTGSACAGRSEPPRTRVGRSRRPARPTWRVRRRNQQTDLPRTAVTRLEAVRRPARATGRRRAVAATWIAPKRRTRWRFSTAVLRAHSHRSGSRPKVAFMKPTPASSAVHRRDSAIVRLRSATRWAIAAGAVATATFAALAARAFPGRSATTSPSTSAVSPTTTPARAGAGTSAGVSGASEVSGATGSVAPSAPAPTVQQPVATSGGSLP